MVVLKRRRGVGIGGRLGKLPISCIEVNLRAATFNSEMGGILKWAVEGCKKWKEEGLEKPESVAEATQEYKTDVDPISLWMGTRYTGNQRDTVPTRLLFDDFMKFARVKRENLKKLGESLDTSWTQTAIRKIDAL